MGRQRGRGADKDIDKRGGFWYSTKVPCANDTRWCGAMAAQLICNQWVAGSTPVTSSKKSYDIPLKSGVCRGAFAFVSPTASPPFRKIMPPGGARVLKSAHHAIIIGSAKQRTSKCRWAASPPSSPRSTAQTPPSPASVRPSPRCCRSSRRRCGVWWCSPLRRFRASSPRGGALGRPGHFLLDTGSLI